MRLLIRKILSVGLRIVIQLSLTIKLWYFRLVVRRRKIRVGFFVVFDTVFQMEKLFELMLGDANFDPYIVIIPDMSRGKAHEKEVRKCSFEFLAGKYGNRVRKSWDENGYLDVHSEYDIITVMNPYSEMTHRFYSINYLARKCVPVFMARYFYAGVGCWDDHFNKMSQLSYLWRFYLENRREFDRVKRCQKLLSVFNRLKVSGYPKIDRMADIVPVVRDRKRVIIAPHHTVKKNEYEASNFVEYKEELIKLPSLYPEIDWVFRPHPLLKQMMINCGYWTEADAKNYFEKLMSYSNVIYEYAGDQYDSFKNSDALIQDCGSFLPEYFYVGKPQCYAIKRMEHYGEFGREMLRHVYCAESWADIINFIDEIVVGGVDAMHEMRMSFAKENLMFNYPHASESILDDIKRSIGRS